MNNGIMKKVKRERKRRCSEGGREDGRQGEREGGISIERFVGVKEILSFICFSFSVTHRVSVFDLESPNYLCTYGSWWGV